MYKINGNPEQFADLGVFHKLSKQFLPYAQKRLGFDKPVGINLLSDPHNAKNPLGKTAYYDPNKMEVTVFVDKRHVKDILRSMAHELVHHTQNCRGEFDGGVKAGEGYAQKDPHMRKMEEEAYLEGQMLLRDFEDNLKEKKVMAEGKKMVKGPDGKMVPDYTVDGEGPGDMAAEGMVPDEEEGSMVMPEPGSMTAPAGGPEDVQPTSPDEGPPDEPLAPPGDLGDEDPEEEDLFEEFPDFPMEGVSDSSGDAGERGMSENWTRKNKGKLLFERLTKKWTK